MSESSPSAATQSLAAHPILTAVARHLAAHFREPGGSAEAAHQDALQAVTAFTPRSLHDYLLIGRLIALSLAAICATGQAIQPEHSVQQQLQFLARANSLGRSAQQAETALEKSRQTRPPQTASSPAPGIEPPPGAPEPPPSHAATPPQPHAAPREQDPLQALIDQVLAEDSRAAARPSPAAAQAMPAERPATQERPTSFREALLRSSVMPAGPSRRR